VELFEIKVAALERAERALAFGSGMAAITACLLANLSSGDHVVAVDTAYGPTRMFINEHMAKYGIEHTYIPGDDINQFREACKPNTKVFFLESPSSMHFLLQDLRAVAALAKEKGIVTMIDNTWATPLYQKPLTLGIDISIHTVSKYMGGHSDIIAGVVAADSDMIKKLENIRQFYGAILGPMEAWLAIRGLRSMPLRVREHGRSALLIAQRLEKHPAIRQVRFPGLESDPQYELAKSQMAGFTSPFSIILDCENGAAREFVKRLKCFNVGPSWGGFESMVTLPHPPGTLVRLHIGLEDAESLYADLEGSLNQI
jgi:cystathionine gamma-lyase